MHSSAPAGNSWSGPDAATCAMVAATLVPLARADPARYLQLSMALAVLAGVVCILAGLCRAGFIANFLSRPILIGFLNGMGLTIIAGQLGKILGFKMEGSDFFPRLAETAAKLSQIHWPTAIFSFALLMLFLGLKRSLPLVPRASRRHRPPHWRRPRIQPWCLRRRAPWALCPAVVCTLPCRPHSRGKTGQPSFQALPA